MCLQSTYGLCNSRESRAVLASKAAWRGTQNERQQQQQQQQQPQQPATAAATTTIALRLGAATRNKKRAL